VWEKTGITPKSIWKKMGEEGFLCMSVPREYGGMGADFLYSVVVTEELALTQQTGLAAPLHSDVVVPYIASYGSEEVKRKYLPGCVSGEIITAIAMTESNAGSDLASIRTTAAHEVTGWSSAVEDLYQQRHRHDLLVLAARDPL
jgi:acyl-CoA dehydrogenase